MTFMAIDVGNTRLKWALYASATPGATPLAQGAQFLEHIDQLAETDWADLPAPRTMLGCVVAGTAVMRRVEEQLDIWDVAPQWVVPSESEGGVVNGYDHPPRLGADRWVAVIGAYRRLLARGDKRPCVVVLVGNATTSPVGTCKPAVPDSRARNMMPWPGMMMPPKKRPDASSASTVTAVPTITTTQGLVSPRANKRR